MKQQQQQQPQLLSVCHPMHSLLAVRKRQISTTATNVCLPSDTITTSRQIVRKRQI